MTSLQLLINALALGSAYALVALGFVLTLNATGAVNFAHGDLVMVGGVLAAVLAEYLPVSIPGAALLPLIMAIMAGLGVVIAGIGYLPLQGGPPSGVLISTIAVGMILQNGALVLAGPEPRAAPALLGGGAASLFGLTASRQSLSIIAAAVVLILGQYWLFTRTRVGRRLRASAQDPNMARACGVPVTMMILMTFALAAGLAGVAGLLLGRQFFVSPTEGGVLMLKAYIAVTIGGWGSAPGAVAGAFIIALFETLVAARFSHPPAMAALYLTMPVIMRLRPQGLFGETARKRA